MERRTARSRRRVSTGLVVTAISAVLLFAALWQAFALDSKAGGDVPTLTRERDAVSYVRNLLPLYVDVNEYRRQIDALTPIGYDPNLRSRIDREMFAANSYTSAHAESLGIMPQWTAVRKLWSRARLLSPGSDPQRYAGKLAHAFGVGLIYKLEDVSGLEYETNRVSQDLADMTFAKMPGALDEALYIDMISEDAKIQRSISIPNRVTLARLLNSISPDQGDLDLNTDDFTDLVLPTLQNDGVVSAADTGHYLAQNAAMLAAGHRFYDDVNANVVLRERPAGSAAVTRTNTQAVVGNALATIQDLTLVLQAQLAQRIGYVKNRNAYVYALLLIGAILLVGIMLMVAEVTARRDREALAKAQQESERLSAELARQSAERALRLSEAQFRAVFDGAALGIAILDRNGQILDANAVFRNIYGENSAGVLEGHESDFSELMMGERDLFEFEQHVMTPDGHEAWTDSMVSLVHDDAGKPYFAICMFRDLTELKRSERRMLHDMTHDTLTGLPNRALFETRVREQFVHLKSSPESPFAVLFVDLDRFKDINESLGHDSGDFVISQVAHRLRAAIEAADVVARLGSDEFAVLVRSLPDVLHVEVIARRVLNALSKPFSLGSRSIYVSASVGIALASPSYPRGEDVMRDADIAMRHAKGGGGSRFAVFDSRMHARAEKRLQLTSDLRRALENQEFDLLFQPIVKIADGTIAGCEALLRWNHTTEGVIGPSDFMPLAEQTGLAVPIGRFVLRTACSQIALWKRAAGRRTLFPINVNVSAAELLDVDFESTLLSMVREFGLDPSELMLEITESVVLDAGTRPNALVERLRSQGFGICIDDFGTGYSSLRYLQQFKVDAIKIDRSFVSGPDGDVASEPIVRTLMTLAEAFDVRVVAEGIETQRQRDVLRNVGCRYGQGYYYARAIAADELAALYPSAFALAARHASA